MWPWQRLAKGMGYLSWGPGHPRHALTTEVSVSLVGISVSKPENPFIFPNHWRSCESGVLYPTVEPQNGAA